MRKLNVVLAALAFGAFGVAAAAATAGVQEPTVTVDNSGTDTLEVVGNLEVDFVNDDFGNTPKAAGSATLAYATQDNTVDGDRSITVSLTLDNAPLGLPAGMTLKLAPTAPTAAAGIAGTKAEVTFSGSAFTAQPLISGIAQFTTGGNANVTYSVVATRGFENFSGKLIYTIGTGL